ncbi:hypothetical protein ACC846_38570, partial [Rhizobium ruizarguesonis]
ADVATRRLGYSFPLGVKRGYHMHYAAECNAVLNNWMLDAERCYLLAPMRRGFGAVELDRRFRRVERCKIRPCRQADAAAHW